MIKDYNNHTEFYCQSSTVSDSAIFEIATEDRRLCLYRDWDHYVEVVSTCHFVRKAESFGNTLICSCPIGSKKQACKHAVAVSVKLKYISYPPQIDSITIEQSRRPGRPRNATRGGALSIN